MIFADPYVRGSTDGNAREICQGVSRMEEHPAKGTWGFACLGSAMAQGDTLHWERAPTHCNQAHGVEPQVQLQDQLPLCQHRPAAA